MRAYSVGGTCFFNPLIRVFVATLFLSLCVCLSERESGAAERHADYSAKAARTAYSGNTKTMKFHNSKCRYFSCKACTARFATAEEAVSKGFVACKYCGG